MRKVLVVILLLGGITLSATARRVQSPNGKLQLQVSRDGYTLQYQQTTVLRIPKVGYEDKTAQPRKIKTPKVKSKGPVVADYQMLAGKRSHCTNRANAYEVMLDYGVRMELRLYNDGLAFRYVADKVPRTFEQTSFLILEGQRRWMQQWTDSYEGFFPLSTTYKVKPIPSFSGISKSAEGYNCRWGYPALLEVDNNDEKDKNGIFALITEANIAHGQSASCLYNEGPLFRVIPDEYDYIPQGEWRSPWRVVIVGTLADVVESTLVTDVSDPSRVKDNDWIHPGVVSWVYWAYNHGSNDFNIIKKYVDMASELRLPYVLIDAEWDEMKDGKTIEDAIQYAKLKHVKPMIWYNSSVGWVDGAPTPKFRLNNPDDREQEFAWCERSGVAGVKIDFFSGDTQKNMDYCQDLLECAVRHHLLVNFHGATVPRGWQRTWPNLLSTEGVYGAEWYNNVATFTEKAASHNATLPFTRNVIGPMDYTPCAFTDSQHPHITSHAHELALTVLFESGLQHLADRPESFLSQPDDVKEFLSSLPAAWDETRFIDGYPGEYVVLARRCGKTWYLAAINGTNQEKTLDLSGKLPFSAGEMVHVFADSGNKDLPWDNQHMRTLPETYDLLPRGGVVVRVDPFDR